MYNENINNEQLLNIIYIKTEQKLKEILELKKTKSYLNETKIAKIKENLLTVFDILSYETNDENLKNILDNLKYLIISNSNKDKETAINFCKNIRT